MAREKMKKRISKALKESGVGGSAKAMSAAK
jgi:hypothetical protein